jgi:hypothetical protein
MKMCFNWKVAAGITAARDAVFAFAPNLIGAAVPVLIIAACPLSMVVMMRAMSGGSRCDPASNGTASEANTDATPSEVARLQAEIDQLRAERVEGQERRPTDQEHVS